MAEVAQLDGKGTRRAPGHDPLFDDTGRRRGELRLEADACRLDVATLDAMVAMGRCSDMLVLGRPGGPLFRPSEVARLGYLAGIVATLLR